MARTLGVVVKEYIQVHKDMREHKCEHSPWCCRNDVGCDEGHRLEHLKWTLFEEMEEWVRNK